MRKTALILLFTFLLTMPVSASFTDLTSEDISYGAVTRLNRLGVMTGYEDNSFRGEQYVTRAQFAKIVTVVSGGEENAVSRMDAGQFSDVTYDHWASGYISYVVSNQIIMGYGDGTFRPEQNINYAEALTVIIRAMGYNADDVGYYWPAGYIEKACAMGLVESGSFDPYAPISRNNIAVLLDKAMYTEGKSGAKLIQVFDMKEYENAVIIATQKTDPSLESDQVSTSAGIFKKGDGLNEDELIGIKADLLADEDNKLVQIVPAEQSVENAVIESTMGKDITVLVNGQKKTVRIDDNTVVYHKGSRSSAAQQRENFVEGNELYMYGSGGSVDYIFLYTYDTEGPYTVMSGGNELISYFDIENSTGVTVIRDGLASSLDEVEKYDVAYYTSRTNTLYIYCDRITGTYDEAYPMKANVTRVTVSGKTYELEGSQAKSKLGEGAGTFKIGDKVTLLIGRDGLAADAVSLGEADGASYGVIVSSRVTVSEESDTKGHTIYYTTILRADGLEVEQESVKDYSDYKGRFVYIDYTDGKMELTNVNYSPVYGEIDRATLSIGGVSLAHNYKIIELVKQEGSSDPVVQCIELSDINKTKLVRQDVIHAQTSNEFGDIMVLYVNNVTNSNYKYGMLTYAKMLGSGTMSVSGSYTVMRDGVETDYKTAGVAYSVYAGQAVGIDVNGASLDGMITLSEVASAGDIDAVAADRIKINGKVYELAEDVQIFRQKAKMHTYTQLSVNELSDIEIGTITLYSDTPASGGIIRVIKIT